MKHLNPHRSLVPYVYVHDTQLIYPIRNSYIFIIIINKVFVVPPASFMFVHNVFGADGTRENNRSVSRNIDRVPNPGDMRGAHTRFSVHTMRCDQRQNKQYKAETTRRNDCLNYGQRRILTCYTIPQPNKSLTKSKN